MPHWALSGFRDSQAFKPQAPPAWLLRADLATRTGGDRRQCLAHRHKLYPQDVTLVLRMERVGWTGLVRGGFLEEARSKLGLTSVWKGG